MKKVSLKIQNLLAPFYSVSFGYQVKRIVFLSFCNLFACLFSDLGYKINPKVRRVMK